MKFNIIILVCLLCLEKSWTQTNFKFSDANFENYLKGNFDVNQFEKRFIKPERSICAILQNQIHADSLANYLKKIVSFNNRNTVNDTTSEPSKGIRGARDYVRQMLNYWNNQNNSVILNSEFEFDYLMCNRTRHTELVSFIPGNGPQKDEMVIIEAHLDSRCEDRCDVNCLAQGAEDNGSGSALIMELARIFSKLELNRSVVIIWITGEEQGLGGSKSFSTYCKNNNVKIKAVFNNDIVGGIECGKTSSAPSCPGPFKFDSIHLRIFSSGTTNSMNKSLARLTKIFFDYNLNISSPTIIDVMFAEDRTGRGSDHIPFRENGFTAIRYTSSYEHGDGNPDQVGYEDRQHSSRDVLGKDLNGDGILDSLYVNFKYLSHNTLVNALSAVNAASSTLPTPILQTMLNGNKLNVTINPVSEAIGYYIGIRKITSAYYDTVFFTSAINLEINNLSSTQYYISACSVDSNYWLSMIGAESLFRITNSVKDEIKSNEFIELIQNRPNPFDDFTLIPIVVHDISKVTKAEMIFSSLEGKELNRINLNLKEGVNEIVVPVSNKLGTSSETIYSLKVNGKIFKSLKMQILNY
ncbi:MAG: M28 family peptidase [Saprospiraceae bacterium]